MSRIGRKPITIPDKVEIKLNGNHLSVKGPKGELSHECHPRMQIVIENNEIIVKRPTDEKQDRSLHGLTRSLIANMVHGVTVGFEKKLEMIGVGYRANMQGKNLNIEIGFSHPVIVEPKAGIEFDVDTKAKNNVITVRGINKQVVGQTAAEIRGIRPPEPYKGKGIKYIDEVIRRKVGKTG